MTTATEDRVYAPSYTAAQRRYRSTNKEILKARRQAAYKKERITTAIRKSTPEDWATTIAEMRAILAYMEGLPK